MKKFQHLTIPVSSNIREAIKLLDKGAKKNLFVLDQNDCLVGALTDGDIRRWIIKKGKLEGSVREICNPNPVFVTPVYDVEELKRTMVSKNIDAVPVVDEHNRILEILFWEELFADTPETDFQQVDAGVVIMAGGRGTRLDPFTRILPKPLIPVGDKTIAEIIMDEYAHYGINKFYLSVNHKANMIKAYFEEAENHYQIDYVKEDKPLGTAGSLRLLLGKMDKTFFVSNCDILIKEDYAAIFDFHKEGNFDLTLVASMINYTIPYGVCELKGEGRLDKILEKPEYNFLINTGMYVLEPGTLEHIPAGEFFHITHLIEKLQNAGKNIGVFPVSAQAYHDIGQWEEYKSTVKKLSF